MRIGMLLDSVFPPDPRVENEAIALIKKGHEVFLFCLHYHAGKQAKEINGIKVRRYPSNTLIYKLSALAYTIPVYTFLMKKKIVHFIKKNRIEAIHIHDIRIAGAAFQANQKFQLPTVLDLHDNMPEVMKFYPHLQKFPGKYIISPQKWKKKEEVFIQKASKVITVSQEFIEELIGRGIVGREKVVLVPNTIRASFYENAIFKEELAKRYQNNFVILYLGDTHLRRGLQTAIESVKRLHTQIPNIKLVIVGKNTTDYILKKQVKDLGITAFVDFEGWQNVSLFPSYIKASDVCISPLHRNIQHDVAYANKLFQYMSFGKPLLVSNATAQKTLVEKIQGGLVHLDRDVEDFSNKLRTLYDNKEAMQVFGNNGKQFVRNHFTWSKTSEALINLYDNLVN
ncbi:glycosyltransferase family 4 protein [Tenacibaculum maritimum]|uniref:glycosyltransferase family 4 protein n=2 Tax=Tenacibaculum maritimum TaxID=107401 RepID=UPI0010A404A4|nr:glycosyltransferase family 4 protein [Tenacibaculum maritimum]MCD9585996.1 glycosyltransferase family 4 protein [Tenacibaculum maritimum]MCD9611530.1 glycosyltransferase family 4 protein [Tenacibaculum maritimum]MCD9619443.1 glycosyltransferase family 4 protein [Tenacibaculum maritimum]MCD9626216.1 glycosyltransferase family 4 protein [Tenacibaculum maritimum]MCD9630578.1 glycosyltransferase family 4 protein [Tenacibaculum maritimum]